LTWVELVRYDGLPMRYREVESRYQELVALRKSGRLSQAEWEQELKALLLQDLKGRYWTIGAQTGKWYYYDGTHWTEGTPQPSLFQTDSDSGPIAPGGQICPHCGFENQGVHALCSRCGRDMRSREQRSSSLATPRDIVSYCPSCGGRMDPHSHRCSSCGTGAQEALTSTGTSRGFEEVVLTRGSQPQFLEASTGTGRFGEEREIRAVNLLSCFRFMGGAGLIVGLVIGVFIGVIRDVGMGLANLIPLLAELKGRWLGGLAFGVAGATALGILSGTYGVLLGLLYNLLAIIFGGLRVKVYRGK